jgi:hypothetical protein
VHGRSLELGKIPAPDSNSQGEDEQGNKVVYDTFSDKELRYHATWIGGEPANRMFS